MTIILKHFLRKIINLRITNFYRKQYRRLLRINNISNQKVDGEEKWIYKWSALGKADPVYFRLFSHYIGNDINIIPEDICRNIVESVLTPHKYSSYYSDKNIFDKLFKQGVLPKTILRKMNGFYYDADYNSIALINDADFKNVLLELGINKILIKPSVDSDSGNGVKVFEIKDGEWRDVVSDELLTMEFLNQYEMDIIIQEFMKQADFMSYFNSTSINTLRLTLYRSVKTNECHVPSAVMRIGANGSLVDNAHAGGVYVGIKKDGVLCNTVLNQFGQKKSIFNDIDFSQKHKIPNWNQILDFAKYIGECIPHHRLVALDIMIDDHNQPRLIEFNCKGYSMWLFQFTVGSAFGEFTDEIIEYCKNNVGKAQKTFTI